MPVGNVRILPLTMESCTSVSAKHPTTRRQSPPYQSVYPKRETLTGVGDEGVLMKDSTGRLRYLVARKGNRGVSLFPFHSNPSDEQLKQLAIAALSH